MIEVVLIAVATLVVLYFVAAPLRRGRQEMIESTDDVAEADADKRTKLGALVELEEERYTGKLTDVDFTLLQRQYEAEAVAALQRLDQLQDNATSDADIEAEIARVKTEMKCPKCGALRRSAGPCPECGA